MGHPKNPDITGSSGRDWTMQRPPAAETVLNGEPYLYFAGTGYLGLQGHPALLAAAQSAIAQYGIHTATSRAGYGTSPPVCEVENLAASWLETERATYLVSGYAGNFAVAAALADSVELAFIDEHAHDCMREATRWLTRVRRPPLVFAHRDVSQLQDLLRANLRPAERALVLTDGLFATSGNLAPLAGYVEILSSFEGSMLLVDDAHGLGVLGEHGRGSLELAGVAANQVNRNLDESSAGAARVFCTTTLSKAVGGHGGLIAGSETFVDRVRSASGWFRGASAPVSAVAAATAKGIQWICEHPELRTQLQANVARARTGLAALGLDVQMTPSPIIGFKLNSTSRMERVHRALVDEHIAIGFARDYPGAGPDGMLRIAIFTTHTAAMIDRLLDAMRRALTDE